MLLALLCDLAQDMVAHSEGLSSSTMQATDVFCFAQLFMSVWLSDVCPVDPTPPGLVDLPNTFAHGFCSGKFFRAL